MALRPHHRHCPGLLLDGGLEPELLERHRQTAAAARFSLGLPIGPEVVTPEPLGVRLEQGVSGVSWGGLNRVDVLAARQLKHRGATAVAVVTRFPDEPPTSPMLQNYRHGRGSDVEPRAAAKELGYPAVRVGGTESGTPAHPCRCRPDGCSDLPWSAVGNFS